MAVWAASSFLLHIAIMVTAVTICKHGIFSQIAIHLRVDLS